MWSRRDFLKSAGTLAASTALPGGVLSVFSRAACAARHSRSRGGRHDGDGKRRVTEPAARGFGAAVDLTAPCGASPGKFRRPGRNFQHELN